VSGPTYPYVAGQMQHLGGVSRGEAYFSQPLLIRAAGVQILAAGHPDRHLEAIVLDTAYRGRGYDHALMVGQGTQLVGVHDARRWPRGDRVAVRLLPSGCLLFPGGAREVPIDAVPVGG
jgi:iron(III) transport system ATP-binding protein